MIVSLEKSGAKGWGVYPGGQSGNPGSTYYSNMVPAWSTGKYYSLGFFQRPEDAGSEKITTLQLNPATK
jgi:penicillin amidase